MSIDLLEKEMSLCSIDHWQTRIEQVVEQRKDAKQSKANLMFLRTIHLQIEKMADGIDEFDSLGEEEEVEDVSDDMDLTYEPPKKKPPIKRIVKQKIVKQKAKTPEAEIAVVESNPIDSGSVSSKTSTGKKSTASLKNNNDDANKKKMLAALVKQHEYLWNKADKKFRNAQIREVAWEKIAKDIDVTGSIYFISANGIHIYKVNSKVNRTL